MQITKASSDQTDSSGDRIACASGLTLVALMTGPCEHVRHVSCKHVRMNEPQIIINNIKETISKFLNDDFGWQSVIYIRVYRVQIILILIYEKKMHISNLIILNFGMCKQSKIIFF